MVGVAPRARVRMVISLMSRARAMRAEPWPMTCRARRRSRVPPASMRASGPVALVMGMTTAAGLVAWRPGVRSWVLAGAGRAGVLMSGHVLGLAVAGIGVVGAG